MNQKKGEDAVIGDLVERLTREHPAVSPATVVGIVDQMRARFDGCAVRDFVPLFVERRANTELARLGG